MQNSQIDTHQFSNGLVLLVESMPWLETAAFSISLPAGSIYESEHKLGLAAVACELSERGCGQWSSRQFLEEVEMLGAMTSNSISTYSTSYGGSSVNDKFYNLLELYRDLTRHASLDEQELEPSIKSCAQELFSQQDDFSQQAMILLRKQFFGSVLGRWPDGSLETLPHITLQDVKEFYKKRYQPQGMILSIAGNVQFDQVKDQVESLWGNWNPEVGDEPNFPEGKAGYRHLEQNSEQTHIALAAPAIPFGTRDYYLMRCAVGVLGDGVSSRLFHEVREERGLCYSIFAGIHTMKQKACLTAYAGTTAERSQETYDVMVQQIQNLRNGVTEKELSRLKVQMRTGLMGQQESCRSRAAAIAGDWFYLNRVRTKAEIDQLISSISADEINQFLSAHPIDINTVVTVGPKPLKVDHANT